jgi:hypothetical protein
MCYGPEFVAKAVRGWIEGIGAKTAYIAPGSPWETDEVEKPFSAVRCYFPLSVVRCFGTVGVLS